MLGADRAYCHQCSHSHHLTCDKTYRARSAQEKKMLDPAYVYLEFSGVVAIQLMCFSDSRAVHLRKTGGSVASLDASTYMHAQCDNPF